MKSHAQVFFSRPTGVTRRSNCRKFTG